MDKRNIILNNLIGKDLIALDGNKNITINEDDTFSFNNDVNSEGHADCIGKIIGDGIVILGYTEYLSGFFEENNTPYTTEYWMGIRNIDGINFTAEISYTVFYDSIFYKEADKSVVDNIKRLYENYEKLIIDIKNGFNDDELKEKYGIQKIDRCEKTK